jgi:hypothetical protein
LGEQKVQRVPLGGYWNAQRLISVGVVLGSLRVSVVFVVIMVIFFAVVFLFLFFLFVFFLIWLLSKEDIGS